MNDQKLILRSKYEKYEMLLARQQWLSFCFAENYCGNCEAKAGMQKMRSTSFTILRQYRIHVYF